jgi:DNA segregation ATPase FtsK/SpoIIIE, S-DNA-T family
MRQRRPLLEIALKIVCCALWLLTAAAVVSFNAHDWPSHAVFPHPQSTSNLVGPVGSFIAYHLVRYAGEGAYALLFFSGVFLVLKLRNQVLGDIWLRLVGLVLLTVSIGAAVRLLSPGTANSLPEGNGGLLGMAAAGYLRSHFSLLGTWVIVAVAFIVGLILTADELVLRAPQYARGAYNRMREGVPSLPAIQLPGFKFPPMPSLPSLQNFRTKNSELTSEPIEQGAASLVNPIKPVGREPVNPTPVVHVKSKADKSNAGRQQADSPAAKLHQQAAELKALDDEITSVVNSSVRPFDPEDIPADDVVAIDYGDQDVAQDDMAHPDTFDVVSEAAVIPSIEEQKVAKPLEPKREVIVRLPSTLKPKTLAPPPSREVKELGAYNLPGWDVLAEAEHGFAENQEKHVREKAAILEQALREFGIDAHVVEIDTGPVITMYEITLAPGIKVGAITSLSNDIARALSAVSVRIVAPVPGKNTVGIEVPNDEKEKVRMKELMQLGLENTNKMAIPLFLGKDASGAPLISDLAAMPHVLIAGTTGSGKSVCINSIIMSVMYTQRPDMVKLILVDPKVVEMAPFKDIPHLMCPVITEAAKATAVLEWACNKMDERYGLLAEAGVRNIKGYNSLTKEELFERFGPSTPEEEAKIPKQLPYIVVIIDELADLMMTSGKEVESHIVRIAQKARAVGIHLVVATQRPQATVVTGLIKSNLPTKIAFRVNSRMDSRIVLDQNGGELLLGQGDMLFMPPGASKPMRSQGTYIDDKEIRESVKLVKTLADAQYEPDLVQIKAVGVGGEGGEERDELFDDAVRVVLETKRGSVSLLQRRLTIGYGRASRIIEQMAECGILGDHKGSQAREPMITLDEWEAMQNQQKADADSGMTV